MLRRPPISTLFPYTTFFLSSLASTLAKVCVFFSLIASLSSLIGSSLLILTEKAFAVVLPLTRQNKVIRSEEHTSELQSLAYLVCRLLLEKKNTDIFQIIMFS